MGSEGSGGTASSAVSASSALPYRQRFRAFLLIRTKVLVLGSSGIKNYQLLNNKIYLFYFLKIGLSPFFFDPLYRNFRNGGDAINRYYFRQYHAAVPAAVWDLPEPPL
jgi:hypothetical protein